MQLCRAFHKMHRKTDSNSIKCTSLHIASVFITMDRKYYLRRCFQLVALLSIWTFMIPGSSAMVENAKMNKLLNCEIPAGNVSRSNYQRWCLKRRRMDIQNGEKLEQILGRFPLIESTQRGDFVTTDTPSAESGGLATGMWAVKLKFALEDESRELLDLSADMIARRHQLENHGQIGELKGYYLFTKKGSAETWTTMASAVANSQRETGRPDAGTKPHLYTTDIFAFVGDEDYEEAGLDGVGITWKNNNHIVINTQVEWQGQQELLLRSKRGYLPRARLKQKVSDEYHAHDVHSTATAVGIVNSSLSREIDKTSLRTKYTALPSTPSPQANEEKMRQEFYINLVNHYSNPVTVTYRTEDVTRNPKYKDPMASHVGAVGGRRMGIDMIDEEDVDGYQWDSKNGGIGPTMFHDPLFSRQWHLVNLANKEGTGDCNVTGVWKYGITGKGVVVAVVDDGVQWDHLDLVENYCPEGSFDLNANDNDPMPVRDDKEENKHGTRCAGEIAAAPNNHCGVGIAYGAKFSGIRILDGPLTDSMEAAAFNKHLDVNDIYSCSWGPEDDGKTVDGPHPLAQAALKHGIITGRQGFGSIYIVASGNGGHKGDNCNYDGYANSIYTITVGAVDEFGRVPNYAEECASMLACTFSSGAGTEDGKARKIVTTDWTLGMNKKRISGCTESHTGTSAATPLAAGMVALMLERRPCLTWRDIQHIMVMTSLKSNANGEEWTTNTAGFHHSDKKGFGLLNAWRLVNAASVWKLVPWLTSVTFECPDRRRVIPSIKSRALIVKTLVTKEQCNQNMVFTLEQVLVTVDIDHARRGDLFISLVCPTGTTSVIGRPRKNDDSASGLWNWAFATVKCWGEQPHGTYRLIIHDIEDRSRVTAGELRNWKLTLYGSTIEQKDINEQRERVEKAMSGSYLQPFTDARRTGEGADHFLNDTVANVEQTIGYCPPVQKRTRASFTFRKVPTERTLKLLALSGCFLLLWCMFCLLDTTKLERPLKMDVSKSNTKLLHENKLKLSEHQPLLQNV